MAKADIDDSSEELPDTEHEGARDDANEEKDENNKEMAQ